MNKNKTPLIFITIQLISFLVYNIPYQEHAHVPIGIIFLIAIGVVNLILLVIYTVLFFRRKEAKKIVWKIPFIVFLLFLIITWFFNNQL